MNVDRGALRGRIRLAAQWFVNSQFRMKRPYWDANHGRFIYNRYRPDGTTIWGLNWTQARGIMVLIAADRLAPDDRYMAAARRAAEYIEVLQILDARDPAHFGAIREEVPQSRDYNIRDQLEAAAGLLYLGAYLAEEQLVDRARIWADWYLAHALMPGTGWPWAFRRGDGTWAHSRSGPILDASRSPYFLAAVPIFMHQLARLLGQDRYVEQGTVPLAKYALAHLFDARGAIGIDPGWSQHAGKTGLVLNEDGAMIGLMAASRATGRPEFARAALGHVEQVAAEPMPMPLLAGMTDTLMVTAEAARLYDHAPSKAWIEQHLATVMELQITDPADREVGAFAGEDEDPAWYSGGRKEDYVTTRTTAYGALGLAKVEGTAVTGGYSTDPDLPVRPTPWDRTGRD